MPSNATGPAAREDHASGEDPSSAAGERPLPCRLPFRAGTVPIALAPSPMMTRQRSRRFRSAQPAAVSDPPATAPPTLDTTPSLPSGSPVIAAAAS